MKALVRFLLIFACMKLIVSKPQHLQEQPQYHLDPLNEPQFEYPPKDPGKRTIGSSRHYAVGKHIGIHPLGFKYVLGYSPINLKYVPVIKPVTVLKPVLQQSIKPLWKPVMQPTRHYLPPIHHVDHGWKPVVPVVKPIHHPKPWVDEQLHTVVQEPVPVVKPVVPPPAFVPVNPLHNYYYFQTPIAKPALLPQVPLLQHVPRPQLPVLPLGATFPAPVLPAHTAPGFVHFPSPPPVSVPVPVHPAPAFVPSPVHPVQHLHPVSPLLPAPHHPVAYPAPHPHFVVPAAHRPVAVPAPPPPLEVPAAHRPVAVPAPPPPLAVPAHAHPPISVEFHGNHHLVPFNGQFPITAVQSPVPLPKIPVVGRQPHALEFQPEIHTNFVPQVTHLQPVGNPQVTHLHPVGSPQVPVHHPPEVQDHGPPQPPFNPEAAIQPGQTDLQVPLHLPHHPHFRQIHGFGHHEPAGHFDPQFPPFQSPGHIVRPSVSLEPPVTHGHS